MTRSAISRRDLHDPLLAKLSVSAVAARRGLVDAAMALHLVVRLAGAQRAGEVRRGIQYDPEPPV